MHRNKISHSEIISSCSKAVLIEDSSGISRRIFPQIHEKLIGLPQEGEKIEIIKVDSVG